MRDRLSIFAVALVALATWLSAQSGQDVFVIRGVRVFDGTVVIENQTVVISEGRIAAIGAVVDVPRNAIEVPGAGRTLLPGLIDSHVHVGINSPADALQQSLVPSNHKVSPIPRGCSLPGHPT